MGRHAQRRAHSGIAARPALLAGFAVLLIAVVAAGLVWWHAGSDDALADGTSCQQTVRVTVAPEVGRLVQRLLDQPLPLGDDTCVDADVTAEEPLHTLADLSALDAGSLPELWVPNPSVWAAETGDVRLDYSSS